ncbi:Aspirochlorine biosynthesis protein N [Echria macrotheca]|uniref:Aspirochlorine biosynthesis protein N n=1 Tax=Echria macrotheca TaxID=438768 RepID=A0AAJ0B2D7_9PEZI|nr:Aspirochlorine biosynthesis protein N [Echria macrotheca]
MASGDVVADLNYLQKLELYQREKPFQLFIPVDPNSPDPRQNNVEFENRPHTIRDMRPAINDFGLDTHGFEIRPFHTSLDPDSFQKSDVVESQYFAEVEQLLRDTLDGGFDRIFFFDWRLRNSKVAEPETLDMNDLTNWMLPACRVHVDQSPRAVVHRVQLQLQDEAPYLLQGRVRIINCWRPIHNAVEDFPLAVCDSTSVPDPDLVECDHVRRRFKGATMYLYTNPEHKWYYLSQQRPDEALIMKMFDSDSTVKAKRCPHTAFQHPNRPPNCPPRTSIEVRALVFNYPPGVQPLVESSLTKAQAIESSD